MPTVAPMPSVAIPALRIPGLHARNTVLDITTVAGEASHPDEFSGVLASSGFEGVRDRTLTGRLGVFSRVVLRAWEFSSEQGATTFMDWLRSNASELIGVTESLEVSVPDGVAIQLHSPTGCCHEEVPIYLASWQRGAVVWTIRASGARIHTAPVQALVRSIAQGG